MSTLETKPEVRDHAGRFAPGHRGGPGRKPRRDLRAILEEVHDKDLDGELAEVAGTLFTLARGGDVAAAALLMKHLVVAAPTQLEVEQVGEQDHRTPEERARQLMSILACAAARDDRLAAQLACIALRSAGDERLRQVADALNKLFPDPNDQKEPNAIRT